MLRKITGGIGITLVILGIGCIESPSLLLPITMIVTGMVLAAASAGGEAKWTESERAQRRK